MPKKIDPKVKERCLQQMLEHVHEYPNPTAAAEVIARRNGVGAETVRRLYVQAQVDQVHVTTVFVTHDQEEAMEVADTIVVMAGGKVRQVGSPDELYDFPADDFVMGFLGPITTLDGALVRPHDLELLSAPGDDTTPAVVTRVTRLGFEVRVDLRAQDEPMWGQVTRGTAEQLDLAEGDTPHLRHARPGHRLMPA